MLILFCTSKLPGAALIRAVTWSEWSHVAIVDGEEVIEAVWPRVKITPLAEMLAKHGRTRLVEIPTGNDAAIIAAARSQVGKPYDWTALFGIFMHRDWQEPDAWFCSELAAWSFAQGGHGLFRPEAMHRVTPQHIWMINTWNRGY